MSSHQAKPINLDPLLRRTIRHSVAYIPTLVIPALVGILMIRVYTSVFSRVEFGQYNVALSTIALMKAIGMVWISVNVVRFYQKYRNENDLTTFFTTLFFCLFTSTLTLTSIGLLINIILLKDFLTAPLWTVINVMIFSFIFVTLFESFVLVFRADLDPKGYSFYWVLYTVTKPIIAIGLIFLGVKVEAVFWGFLISSLVLSLGVFLKLGLFHHIRPRFFSTRLAKEFSRFGTPIAISGLALWLLTMSDRYMLEYFTGSEQVGLYSLGYLISEKTLQFIYMTLMLAAYPVIVDHWEKHGRTSTQSLITEFTRYFLLLCTPVLVLLMSLPNESISLFSNTKFVGGATVLPLIAIGVFFGGLNQYVGKSFELCKKSSILAFNTILAGICGFLLNLYLIPRMGILGAGYSTCFAYVVYFVISVWTARKLLAWIPPYSTILKTAFAAILMAANLKIMPLLFRGYLMITISVFTSIVVYLMALYITRETSLRNMKILIGDFSKTLIK